jgi:hypothetical protein
MKWRFIMAGKKKANVLSLVLAGIVFVAASVAFLVGITAKSYVNDIVMDAGMTQAITDKLMDTVVAVTGTENVEQVTKIQDSISNSSSIKGITEKYTKAMTDGIISGKDFDELDIDISDELSLIANKTIDSIESYVTMTDLQKSLVNTALGYSEVLIKNSIDTYVKDIYGNIQLKAKNLIEIYRLITSKTFVAGMLILSLMAVVIILAINPLRITRVYIAILFIISGIIYAAGVNICCNNIVPKLSNIYLGRTVIINSPTGYMILGIMVMIGVTFALITTMIYSYQKKSR